MTDNANAFLFDSSRDVLRRSSVIDVRFPIFVLLHAQAPTPNPFVAFGSRIQTEFSKTKILIYVRKRQISIHPSIRRRRRRRRPSIHAHSFVSSYIRPDVCRDGRTEYVSKYVLVRIHPSTNTNECGVPLLVQLQLDSARLGVRRSSNSQSIRQSTAHLLVNAR